MVEREIVLAIDALEETFTVVAGEVPANPDGLGRQRGEVEPCVAPVDPETQSPIGGRVRSPRTLTRVPPAFPDYLREAELEGRVRLSGRVSADGTLADVTVWRRAIPTSRPPPRRRCETGRGRRRCSIACPWTLASR